MIQAVIDHIEGTVEILIGAAHGILNVLITFPVQINNTRLYIVHMLHVYTIAS
jgi:hypothetical protein